MANNDLGARPLYVLITGCSEGGIGAALARSFAETGQHHVFATARTVSKIPAALHASSRVSIVRLDVTKPESISDAVKSIDALTGGRLDILVNNSGAGLVGLPILDTDMESIRNIFDVNVFGLLAVTQAFAPMLVRAGGIIVNNSSLAGERVFMYNGIYAASKAAVTMASECLRLEVAPLGVKVITLVTGVVQSHVMANQRPVKISPDSFYISISPDLEKIPDEIASTAGMSLEEYADRVRRCVGTTKGGKVWIGNLVTVLRNLVWWLPDLIWDRMNYRKYPMQSRLQTAICEWRRKQGYFK